MKRDARRALSARRDQVEEKLNADPEDEVANIEITTILAAEAIIEAIIQARY